MGDGSPTREFLHVKDAARAIVLATEKYNKPDPVNIGTGQEISIKYLANLIANIIKFEGEIEWDISKPNGQPRRCLDTSKALEAFGYKSKIPFDKGLTETIDWYVKENNIKI